MIPRAASTLPRLALAMLGVVAITYQFADSKEHAGLVPANFFSFFTIQSNLLAIAMLALTAAVPKESRTRLLEAIRGGVVLSMAMTGIIFALFLSGDAHRLNTTLPWVNDVVHRIMPAVIVLDWLLDPPRHRLGLRVALAWLTYPLAYVVYTLIRGAVVDWYPYPFLDVDRFGYDGVLGRCALLLVGVVAAALAVAVAGELGRRWAGVPQRSGLSTG